MDKKINVTVWNEFVGEKESEAIRAVYPDGIHNAITGFLRKNENIGLLRTATLDMPEHGLTDEVLNTTDVLVWWGHTAHHLVSDEIIDKAVKRVIAGMGFIALHSSHASKIFSRLMGTDTHRLRWRESDECERVWVIDRTHPITKGLGEYIDIKETEMYGERFGIPKPDDIVFISWYNGGEIFRSGCTFKRGFGKIFYFSPGHESCPIYYMPEIQTVINNAVEWANPICYPDFGQSHVETHMPLPGR